jgi:hypothetical protein
MPLLPIILAVAAGALYLVYRDSQAASAPSDGPAESTASTLPQSLGSLFQMPDLKFNAPEEPAGGLPDIAPADQGGSYSRAYDDAFYVASQKTGIPFAWIKGQSLRENGKQNASAQVFESSNSTYSYGLMQINWRPGKNRFAFAGYPDDAIGDGSILYDPYVNTLIGASFLKDGWDRFGNLRDAINQYNTGVAESKRVAPGNYVNDVIRYYSTLVRQNVG